MKNELVCLGHQMKVLQSSGDYDIIEGTTFPNVPGPPPHYHATYAESFYVLEGRMEFLVDGDSVLVEQGNSIDLPKNTPHTFRNAGDAPCRWLNIHSPKGFLFFFEEFGINANEENAFEKSVDGAVIASVLSRAASFDMQLVQPEK